jgi:hypothetical protein
MMALSTIRKSPRVSVVGGGSEKEENRPDDGIEQPENQRSPGQLTRSNGSETPASGATRERGRVQEPAK